MSRTTYERWIQVRHYRGESPERVQRRAARIIRRSLGDGPERLDAGPWVQIQTRPWEAWASPRERKLRVSHLQYLTRREHRSATVTVMQSHAITVTKDFSDAMRRQALRKLEAFAKEQGRRVLEHTIRWERGLPGDEGVPWIMVATLE